MKSYSFVVYVWLAAQVLCGYKRGLRYTSNSLQLVAAIVYVANLAMRESFNLNSRFKVYDSLYAEGNFLLPARSAEGAEVAGGDTPRWALPEDFSGLRKLVRVIRGKK
eukprot:5742268-Pyramimonas_sp.AAC.1